ncbi:hypothetical protein [Flagellimonas sp.]|uniref:hypothetical protein n=1 Tax=Flagellimonas sp. TaxID=2058762 RepID=UPI003B590BBA
MHLLIIVWTFICASIIMGYPIYLLNKSYVASESIREMSSFFASNTIELISFDVCHQLPGWSLSLDVPQITEEILHNSPILFYLESNDSCQKLPVNNIAIGYSAKVYKNVGKVYITFKSLADEVSNFYVPSWHLNKLKILIIKSRDKRLYGDWETVTDKSAIYKGLKKAGVDINNYDDILGYFSNIASIDFKGHFKESTSKHQKQKPSHKLSVLNADNNKLPSAG